jgi:hypothetical protein
MSFGAVAAIVCVLTIVAGTAATHHPELRDHRWLKIGLSLPIMVLVASVFYELGPFRGYFAMFGLGILGFIWKSPIAHLFTAGITPLIYGNMHQNSGIRGEFGGPRALFKHGDLEDMTDCFCWRRFMKRWNGRTRRAARSKHCSGGAG